MPPEIVQSGACVGPPYGLRFWSHDWQWRRGIGQMGIELAELLPHRVKIHKALGRVFGEAGLQKRTEADELRTQSREWLCAMEMRQFLPGVPAKGQLARRHLKQEHPEGIDIGPHINLAWIVKEFGRHVRAGASHRAQMAWPNLEAMCREPWGAVWLGF